MRKLLIAQLLNALHLLTSILLISLIEVALLVFFLLIDLLTLE
jgi:hypothetical protein